MVCFYRNSEGEVKGGKAKGKRQKANGYGGGGVFSSPLIYSFNTGHVSNTRFFVHPDIDII